MNKLWDRHNDESENCACLELPLSAGTTHPQHVLCAKGRPICQLSQLISLLTSNRDNFDLHQRPRSRQSGNLHSTPSRTIRLLLSPKELRVRSLQPGEVQLPF